MTTNTTLGASLEGHEEATLKDDATSKDSKKPPDVSAGKSLTLAYVLWFFGGLLGLHHVYLGRDLHAFATLATCNGFGFGWLRDAFKMSAYVKDCNELAPHKLSRRQKLAQLSGSPQSSTARHLGSLLLGYLCTASYLAALPEDWFALGSNDPTLALLRMFAPAAMAVGVYVVGNIGSHRLQWKWTLIAAYGVFFLLGRNVQDNILFMTSLTIWGANWKGKSWRLTDSCRRPLCRRLLLLAFVSCIYFGMWGSALWNNATITTKDGETVKLKDAVDHFFHSPAWREMKETLHNLWQYWWYHGSSRLWEEFITALDPQGESNAYRIIELSPSATQKDIKAQCRQLSAKYHPDRLGGDEKRFIAIQEACNRLSEIRQKRLRTSSSSRASPNSDESVPSRSSKSAASRDDL